jgi:hypothetical protein
MKKYEFWGIIILICIGMIVIGLVAASLFGSYDIKFTMDNNTLEAVKSIKWSALPK